MKRLLGLVLLLAAPAFAQTDMVGSPCNMTDGSCGTPTFTTIPAPTGCASTEVAYFLGTPPYMACADATYVAATKTLTVPYGTVSARNLTATALATPGAITVTPTLTKVATITTVAGSALVDGDYFTIRGTGASVLPIEFDATPGDGTTGGRVPYVFAPGDTADQIRDGLITLINGATVTTHVVASIGGAAVVNLAIDAPATAGGTNSEAVTDAGFAVTGFADPTHATTVTYKLVALLADGTTTEAGAASSTAAATATLSASNYNRLTWSAVSGAASYRVYRTVAPTTPATTGIVYSGAALTVDDTGLAGGGETAPTVNGTGRVTSGALTSGRVPYVGAGGRVEDDAGLTYDAPTDTLTVMGPLYTYATGAQAFSNGSAVLLQSQLTKASSVFGVYVDTTHNSDTGDVYGLLANAAKGAGKLGKVLAVEGYASFPHQGDNSTHYGITGDVRADANGKSGTLNVGAWALAAGAATDIGLLVSTVPNESGLPASGNYAVYSGASDYATYLAGNVGVGTATPTVAVDVLGNATVTALATPGSITVTPQGTGGAVTWTYKLVARSGSAWTEAGAASSTAAGNATLDVTNFNRLTWAAVPGATIYDVYRTAVGTTPATTGLIWSGTTLTVDDTGLAGSGAVAPIVNTTGRITATTATLGGGGWIWDAAGGLIPGYLAAVFNVNNKGLTNVGTLYGVRVTLGSRSKAIVDATPTAFATFDIADAETYGGNLIYSVVATKGTALQRLDGEVRFSATREGSTYTAVAGTTHEAIEQTLAAAAGTLTGGVTIACAAGVCTLSATFDTSQASPDTFVINYRFDSPDAALAITPL